MVLYSHSGETEEVINKFVSDVTWSPGRPSYPNNSGSVSAVRNGEGGSKVGGGPGVSSNKKESRESKKIRDSNTTTLMLIVVITVRTYFATILGWLLNAVEFS